MEHNFFFTFFQAKNFLWKTDIIYQHLKDEVQVLVQVKVYQGQLKQSYNKTQQMNTTNPALIHGKRPEEVKYLNKRY